MSKKLYRYVGVKINDIRNVTKQLQKIEDTHPEIDTTMVRETLNLYNKTKSAARKREYSEMVKGMFKEMILENKQIKFDPVNETIIDTKYFKPRATKPIAERAWVGLNEEDFKEMYERVPQFQEYIDEQVKKFGYELGAVQASGSNPYIPRSFMDAIGLSNSIEITELDRIMNDVGFFIKK